jgi:hypothetical protein
MAEVRKSITIDAHASDWSVVGDPARIGEWVPALASSTANGSHRACTLQDGAEIVERILDHSDEKRFYVYEITSSPLPLEHHRSMLVVHGHDGHSHVVWEAQFDADSPEAEEALIEAFGRIYDEGLATLRDRFEAAVPS